MFQVKANEHKYETHSRTQFAPAMATKMWQQSCQRGVGGRWGVAWVCQFLPHSSNAHICVAYSNAFASIFLCTHQQAFMIVAEYLSNI